MSIWTQVGENLVRHRGGTIYLRAKVRGKVIRVSLETTDLRIAKIKRDDRLAGIRLASPASDPNFVIRTVGDALRHVKDQLLLRPDLTDRTKRFYKDICQVLDETLPVTAHGRTWTTAEAVGWWNRVAGKFAAQRANNVLGVAKRVGKSLVDAGVRMDNPTDGLKRVKIIQKVLTIPTRQQIDEIAESIRSQRKANSEISANYVLFLAFAGCRHGQAQAFHWEHIDGDWLVFPSGVEGSKGGDTRRLPISPPLRAVLDAMRKPDVKTGPIFSTQSPKNALWNACERLKIPHIRIHDLRHFFGSYALQSGVDIPTVAKWMGHRDGGKLLLKTYSHIQDEHSLKSAAKLL